MTNKERAHLAKVAELGCVLCNVLGLGETPCEIHHLRAGMGMGQRNSHFNVIGLCPEHHRGSTGLHGMGTRGFAEHYGQDEQSLLIKTKVLLNAD